MKRVALGWQKQGWEQQLGPAVPETPSPADPADGGSAIQELLGRWSGVVSRESSSYVQCSSLRLPWVTNQAMGPC